MRRSPVRLVVADRHPVIHDGVAACLSNHSNIELVGAAHDVWSLDQALKSRRPDVVLLDVLFGQCDQIAYLQDLALRHPKVALLISICFADMELVHQLLRAGARGCVLKGDSAHDVFCAVDLASRGDMFLSSALRARSPDAPTDKPCLTFRESQILSGLAMGQSSKWISGKLGISDRTVEQHYVTLRRKLQIGSRAELIAFAVENQYRPRVGGSF